MRGVLRVDRSGGGRARGQDMGGQGTRGEGDQGRGRRGVREGGGGEGGVRARDLARYDDEPRTDHYYYGSAERSAMEYVGVPSHPPVSSTVGWYYSMELADSPLAGVGPSSPRRGRYASPRGGHFDGGLRDPPPNDHEAVALRSSSLEVLLKGGGEGRPRGGRAMAPTTSISVGEEGLPSTTAGSRKADPILASGGMTHTAAKPRGRSTPYLTESNRQDIMERIRRGEKQADLAKEYNVSRAAITNLKQRRQMLEMLENSTDAKDREEAVKRRRLSHAHPPGGDGGADGGGGLGGGKSLRTGSLVEDDPHETKHTRRCRPDVRAHSGSDSRESDGSGGDWSTTTSARTGSHAQGRPGRHGTGEVDWADTGPGTATVTSSRIRPPRHREVNAQTTSRLLATLLDPTTPERAFRSAATRHARLLLEETIGWSFSRSPEPYEPFALACGGDEAAALLTEYLLLEPASASATLRHVELRDSGADIEIVARVPVVALRHGPVFVFLDDLVTDNESPGELAAHGFNDAMEALALASDASGNNGEGTADSETQSASITKGTTLTPLNSTMTATALPPATRDLLFVIHALVFGGLAESQIVLAVGLCDECAAREIGRRFPDVQLLATKFLTNQTPPTERQRVAAYRSRRRALLRTSGVPVSQ